MAGSMHPQVAEPNAPLEALAMSALRRYGDGVAGSVDNEVILMFLEFGNLIIAEWNAHPYWSDYKMAQANYGEVVPDIKNYISPTESREIPDDVIIAGLLYHYAVQQLSAKAQFYMGNYARTMNQRLLMLAHGSGRHEFTVVDDGSRGGRS